MRDSLYSVCIKTIEWSLIFIITIVPLIINPKAFDYWYRPKIESVYALLIIAGVAWLVKALLKDRSFLWENSPLTIPLLSYTFAATLSTIFSIDVRKSLCGDPFRMEGLYTIWAYVALVFLFINQVKTKDLARRLFIGLFLGASLVSLYGLVQYFGYNPTEHFFYKYLPRRIGVGSTIGNSNFLGKYLVLIIPIIFSLCLGEISFKKKLLLILSLFLCFASLIATFTRASWLGIGMGLMVFLFLGFRNSLIVNRGKRLMMLGMMFLLIILFFNTYSPESGTKKVSSPDKKVTGEVTKRAVSTFDVKKDKSMAARLFVWKRALGLIKKRPWFGHGPETFEIAFKKHNIEYLDTFNDVASIDRAHNNYIDTAFSLGLIGLGIYLTVIGTFLYSLFNLLKRADDTLHKLLYAGIISGYCGYLVNDLFIFSVVSVSPTFWSLMGLIVAKGRLEH